MGLRIDHLLLSPSLAGRVKAAGVDRAVRGWDKASDHAPTWIELGNEEKRTRTSGVRRATRTERTMTEVEAPARDGLVCPVAARVDGRLTLPRRHPGRQQRQRRLHGGSAPRASPMWPSSSSAH
jgi:hypothetical protein